MDVQFIIQVKDEDNYPKERNLLSFSISFSRFTFALGNKKFNKKESVAKIAIGLRAKETTGSWICKSTTIFIITIIIAINIFIVIVTANIIVITSLSVFWRFSSFIAAFDAKGNVMESARIKNISMSEESKHLDLKATEFRHIFQTYLNIFHTT